MRTWYAALFAAGILGIIHPSDAQAQWRPAHGAIANDDGLPVHKAAFPDGVDTRRVINAAMAPFVAQVGLPTTRGFLTFANGFQVLNNRILVMPIHAVYADGKIITRDGAAGSARGRALFAQVRLRACGDQIYRVEHVVDHGDIANRADTGNDWLVGILDRPTCVAGDHIPNVLPLGRKDERKYLLPGKGSTAKVNQLEIRQYAETPWRDLNNSDLVARNGRNQGARQRGWPARDSRLTVASGFITGEKYYRVVERGNREGAIEWIKRSQWKPGTAGYGRLYETRIPHSKGNSGAPVLASGAVERNGRRTRVNGVVGMVVSDVVDGRIARNYLMPLRDGFFQALIKANLGILANRY